MLNRISPLLTIIVCFVSLGGCLSESNFRLSPDSRLPKWFSEEYEVQRSDMTVTLDLYSHTSEAVYTLKLKEDGNIFSLKTISGHVPYPDWMNVGTYKRRSPGYYAFTIDGITDIIEFRRPEPFFYMSDDPEKWDELKEMGETRFNQQNIIPVNK
ncbi:MAG: hypothetical protein R3E64_05950 [Halioglobus sp.]